MCTEAKYSLGDCIVACLDALPSEPCEYGPPNNCKLGVCGEVMFLVSEEELAIICSACCAGECPPAKYSLGDCIVACLEIRTSGLCAKGLPNNFGLDTTGELTFGVSLGARWQFTPTHAPLTICLETATWSVATVCACRLDWPRLLPGATGDEH